MNKEAIGREIRRYRSNSKIKVKDLAEMLEVSQPYISMIENGKGNLPTKTFLKKFSNVISQYHSDLSSESIYISLCVIAGYPIDEKLIDTHGKDVFHENERRGYIEFVDENKYKTLDKPYYDLHWLLDQNDNNVFFSHSNSLSINENSEFQNVRLDSHDKSYIKKFINDYLSYKSSFISEFPFKVIFEFIEEDRMPYEDVVTEVLDEEGNGYEYVNNITGTITAGVYLRYINNEINFNLKIDFDFDIDSDKELTSINLYIDTSQLTKFNSLNLEYAYKNLFNNELGEFMKEYALDSFNDDIELVNSPFVKVHHK
ncbi:helix-turn-helix domain-containing protein [Piscibacillus sp. B03]|uniref:helix-turn-helix domain-containing protein n=1 Tax=Piscibacillus sp. B03 TaxID=3457430 RepID=UPI003FCC57B0